MTLEQEVMVKKIESAFMAKNFSEQDRLCKEAGLNRKATYWNWRNSSKEDFEADIIRRIEKQEGIEVLCDLRGGWDLRLYPSENGGKYLQMFRNGKYIPWKDMGEKKGVITMMKEEGKKYPEKIMEFLYSDIDENGLLSDWGWYILNGGHWNGLLPALDRAPESDIIDEAFMAEKDPLKEALDEFYSPHFGEGYFTPPAIDDAGKWDNRPTLDEFQREAKRLRNGGEELDSKRWGNNEKGGKNQGKALAKLICEPSQDFVVKTIKDRIWFDKPEQRKFWFKRILKSTRDTLMKCGDIIEEDIFRESEELGLGYGSKRTWKVLRDIVEVVDRLGKYEVAKAAFDEEVEKYIALEQAAEELFSDFDVIIWK